MPQLVVITGPIASGKSTVAAALAARFRDADHAVAVVDIDDVVAAVGGFAGLPPTRFEQARTIHGKIVGGWLDHGLDVIAHGGFIEQPQDDLALLHAVPADIQPRRVRLHATFEVALERVTADAANRDLSKDPDFLRESYRWAGPRFAALPPAEWTFDTTTTSAAEIVDVLAAALLST